MRCLHLLLIKYAFLIFRWGIYIHGAIDGFSRVVTFLYASTNNKSATVLSLFKQAVSEYGVPSRIRVDKGVENEDVCKFMEEYRGRDRGSAIKGKSCHNVRIERYWVEVWNNVVSEYYDLFTYLEYRGVLDITDEDDIKILQFVFLPRLNYSLEQNRFQNNNHGLSTENHRSPNALFVTGILNNMNSDCIALRDLISEPNASAVNENEPEQIRDETHEGDDIFSTLRTELLVTEDLNNVPHGGDLYVRAKQILSRVLRD